MQRRVRSRWLVVVALSLLLVGGLAAVTAVGAGTGAAADSPAVAGSSDGPLAAGSTSHALSPADVRTSTGSGAASTAGAASSAADASAAQSGDAIVERVEYHRLPDEPGLVQARLVYELPDNVGSLRFRIGGGQYELVETEGFDRNDSGVFVWDESGDGGSVTIRHAVGESFRPESEDDRYVGGTEDWAIVTRPLTHTSYEWSWDKPAFEYRLDTTTEGYAGKRFAFLGPHETMNETVGGEQLTLVVPDAAEPASDPAAILDSLAYASDRLRFQNRNDEVVTIVAPTGEIDWGPPGLAIGADTRVAADARVDDRINIWVHEYVHTRQYRDAEVAEGDAVADDAHWLIEGSAEYYAALTSLEQGRIDFETFQSVLDRGTAGEYDDVVLEDRSTWANNDDAKYEKGALVVGAMDRELRAATNGSATFQAVMEDWNTAETFTAADLEDAAAEHGDEGVRSFVETHTHTTETPSSWNRSTHAELFGGDRARFDYRVVADPPLSVTGPYREGDLSEPLVVGENVSTTVRVENVGDGLGTYSATLAVGGDDRAVAFGSLAPGESTTVDLPRRLTRTGDLRIVAGDVSRTVRVREPATPAIVRLQAEPSPPVAGDQVAVTLEVANPSNRPANGTVTVRADGEAIGSERVRLAPRENDTIELTTRFDDPGTYNVTADGRELQLTVQEGDVLDRMPVAVLGGLVGGLVVALTGGGLLFRRYRS